MGTLSLSHIANMETPIDDETKAMEDRLLKEAQAFMASRLNGRNPPSKTSNTIPNERNLRLDRIGSSSRKRS
jgi:hypothetical protein